MPKKKNGSAAQMDGRPTEVLAVLHEPAEARKQYFRNYKVGHARILEVAQELLRLINEPSDAEVIYLLGPTGVGKTTLIEYVIVELYKAALPELENKLGHLPAAFMQAENPDKGSYDWRDHYINTLLALNEVLIDQKVYLPTPADKRDGSEAPPEARAGGRAALRRAAQKTLKNRIMYAFFVDEAQYITKRKSGEGLMNQADTIRSIASKSETLHILVGTYDLRHLRNLNGHLGRRSHTVHFRRYRTEGLSEEDQIKELSSFSEAFLDLQAHIPVMERPDLTTHMEFCFERCLGCVGRLKSWLRRSLAVALEEDAKTITSGMFLKTAPSKAVWRQIAQEIKDGEDALDDTDEELDAEIAKVSHAAGWAETTGNTRVVGAKGQKTGPDGKGKSGPSGANRKHRPFIPKAERYPVGGRESAG